MNRPPAVDPDGVRIANAAQREVVQRYAEGSLSGEMAVMYCLEAVPDVDALFAALDAASTRKHMPIRPL
jgi:hypothetical protein